MLYIDTEEMLIELTRGDSASIVFSAKTKDGKTYEPHVGEILKFAVAKKWGGIPLMEIPNTLGSLPTTYEEASPTQTEYELEPEHYYTESGGTYTQCTSADAYDSNEQYYILDFSEFWTIQIQTSDWLESGEDKFKFADYVWDLQLTTSTGADTIIGKTDDITPTFRVLGEVATE